ncbi:MAG: aminomethyltransferase family protein [Pseudomonadota bacterium]
MLKESPFFEFLNRRDTPEFSHYLAEHQLDEDYIDWNGSLLPQDYGDAEAEYNAVRSTCACFDVSPMRKIRITGADAGAFLDVLLTRPVSHTPDLRGVYVIFCNSDGSLKDDAILYKFAHDDYLLLPSDIDHTPYFDALASDRGLTNVTFTECTAALAGLAIQGPSSARVMQSFGFAEVTKLKPYEFQQRAFAGTTCILARMGFTADLGYELWLPPEHTPTVQATLQRVRDELALDIPGYGLRALETCRIEGGFVVAGWDFATELDDLPGFERNPYEVGLGWAVDLDGPDFVGKEALATLKTASTYVIRRIRAVTQIPLEGHDLYAEIDGVETEVGSVNCASWSWGFAQMIGNASIRKQARHLEQAWATVEGTRVPVQLTRGAYIDLERRNLVPAPLA